MTWRESESFGAEAELAGWRLSEGEIQKLEDIMHDPAKYGLPATLQSKKSLG